MSETVIYSLDNGIAKVTLNRPEAFNAFDDEQSFALQDVLKKIEKDPSVRVVILSGAGKAFCSGQDLKAISGQKRSLSESIYKRYNPIIRALRNLPVPIIAKLNGVAAGAGCSLALACDIIIAAEEASLIEVFINVGLIPDSGSTYFLPRLVGAHKAFELATLGSKITAQQALDLGIVYQVVPADKLDESVLQLANTYAQKPTKAIGYIKKMLNQSFHSDLEHMLQLEAWYQELAGRTEDYKEGVSSFVEKRKPQFKGR